MHRIDNRSTIKGAVLSAGALIASSAAATAATSDPRGVWINDTGRGAIEIKDCGGGLCGHVVWTRDASDTKGCGRQIIGDAAPQGSGVWDGGWIYSPEKKRKYDVELKPLADGTLRVKGYAGSKLFSKTMIWTAAPTDLARCGEKPTVEAKADVPARPAAAAPSAPVEAKPAAKSGAAALLAAAPRETASLKAAPEAKVAPAANTAQPQPASEPRAGGNESKSPAGQQTAAADTGDAGDDTGDAGGGLDLGRLKDLKLGNGYGLKETSGGKCQLKVPFVTIKVKCPD